MDIKMTRNMRFAYRALKRIGAPVFVNEDNIPHKNFQICAERQTNDPNEKIWADSDYTDRGRQFRDNRYPGFDRRICDILVYYDIYPEWTNAASAMVWPNYEA